MAIGEKIVDGAIDSVGYAAKDGLKTFLTVGAIFGILGALAIGGLVFAGIAAASGGAAAVGAGGIAASVVTGLLGGVLTGGSAGWFAGKIGAAWGLVTGPFRGAKERQIEREENPTLAQGVSREQELDMLRAQNQNAREQLNAMSAQMMQPQTLGQQAAQNAAINGGSQLPPDGFVAQENARRGFPNAGSDLGSSDIKMQNKKFVESLANGNAAVASRG